MKPETLEFQNPGYIKLSSGVLNLFYNWVPGQSQMERFVAVKVNGAN